MSAGVRPSNPGLDRTRHPDRISADERLDKVAEILALGLVRLLKQSSASHPNWQRRLVAACLLLTWPLGEANVWKGAQSGPSATLQKSLATAAHSLYAGTRRCECPN